MNRIIAILHKNDNMLDNVQSTVQFLIDNKCAAQLYVFTSKANESFNIPSQTCACSNVVWPSSCDTEPKIRNWINLFFKTNNFNGMLHVIEDSTKFLKDPTTFMNEIEHTMDVLDYSVWFSTISDTCNFVYSKYNPRLCIVLDKVEYFQLELNKELLFTSHSNTQWIIYDYNKITDDLLRFDEDFTIAMFYIIEYLARRRNTKTDDQLYFMNQYLTIDSEKGVYTVISSESTQDDPNVLKKEDELFKSKNIAFRPDNNIDVVLEILYRKLNSKLV